MAATGALTSPPAGTTTRGTGSRRPRRVPTGLLVVVLLYLAAATTTAWLTPAWETNDESAHVAYAQTVAAGELPVIGEQIESAQPPLYYATVALWMKALRMGQFSTATHPNPAAGTSPQLQLLHDYTPEERAAALAVHWLRMLSVLFGLVTVLCTFVAGKLIGLSRPLALSATATVALWPKFLVVSGSVQNDTLTIAVCSVLVVLTLRWLTVTRAGSEQTWSRTVLALGIGLTAGAGVLTKYTTLPLICLLGLVMLAACWRPLRWRPLAEVLMAAVVALAVCAWWLVRNLVQYGDLLGTAANVAYLQNLLPGLAKPASLLDAKRFGEFVPRTLVDSTWYIGGWNQFVLPFGISLTLTMLAAASVLGAARASLRGSVMHRPSGAIPLTGWHNAVLWAGLAAAFGAVIMIALDATQAQGRYLFIAMVPIALLLTIGTAELTDVVPRVQRMSVWLWPVAMGLTALYAARLYLLPFAGL